MKPKQPKKRDPKPNQVSGKVESNKLNVKEFKGTIYYSAMNFDADIFIYGFRAFDENGVRVDPEKIRKSVDGNKYYFLN